MACTKVAQCHLSTKNKNSDFCVRNLRKVVKINHFFAHILPKQLPSKPYVIQEDTSNALINSAARNQLP